MVAQLAELTQITDEAVAKGLLPSQLEQNSIVQHLVCTQVFSKNVAAPVQGLAVSFPPPKLHCILQDFKVWNSLKKKILPLFTHGTHIWAHALRAILLLHKHIFHHFLTSPIHIISKIRPKIASF